MFFRFFFILTFVFSSNAFAREISVIFYGAGNYDDEKGSEDLAIFSLADSSFIRPEPGNSPRKREILGRTILELQKKFGRGPTFTVYINDKSENAARSAHDYLKQFCIQRNIKVNIILALGDYTELTLSTDLAYLDNPDEPLFYNLETGKPWETSESADKAFANLTRLADLSKAGLQITTYYHDAIGNFRTLLNTQLIDFGNGHPYIWPDGRVDLRGTKKYVLRPRHYSVSTQTHFDFPQQHSCEGVMDKNEIRVWTEP